MAKYLDQMMILQKGKERAELDQMEELELARMKMMVVHWGLQGVDSTVRDHLHKEGDLEVSTILLARMVREIRSKVSDHLYKEEDLETSMILRAQMETEVRSKVNDHLYKEGDLEISMILPEQMIREAQSKVEDHQYKEDPQPLAGDQVWVLEKDLHQQAKQ
jgi:hypothetical protein